MLRRLLLIVSVSALFAVLAAGAASSGEPTARASAAVTVKVGDYYYSRSSVTIRKGQTVGWRWVGDDRHNVKGPGFRSALKRSGTYSRRFNSTGSRRIICTIHESSMRMTVKVR